MGMIEKNTGDSVELFEIIEEVNGKPVVQCQKGFEEVWYLRRILLLGEFSVWSQKKSRKNH